MATWEILKYSAQQTDENTRDFCIINTSINKMTQEMSHNLIVQLSDFGN